MPVIARRARQTRRPDRALSAVVGIGHKPIGPTEGDTVGPS